MAYYKSFESAKNINPIRKYEFMLWILMVLLTTFLWAWSNIFDKALRAKFIKSSTALTASFGFFGLILSIVLFLFIGIPFLPATNFIAALISGIIIVFVVIFYIKALSVEEASRVIPLWHMTPIFVLVLAVIFLDEVLSFLNYLAFVIILVGGFLISTRRTGKKFHLSPALFLMLASSFLGAISDVLLKFAHSADMFWHVVLVYYFAISLGALTLFFLKSVRTDFMSSVKTHRHKFLFLLLLTNILGYSGNLAWNSAIQLGPVTLVSVFIGFQSVFVLLIATILSIKFPLFIKEAIDIKTIGIKLVAIALMIFGLYLLSF